MTTWFIAIFSLTCHFYHLIDSWKKFCWGQLAVSSPGHENHLALPVFFFLHWERSKERRAKTVTTVALDHACSSKFAFLKFLWDQHLCWEIITNFRNESLIHDCMAQQIGNRAGRNLTIYQKGRQVPSLMLRLVYCCRLTTWVVWHGDGLEQSSWSDSDCTRLSSRCIQRLREAESSGRFLRKFAKWASSIRRIVRLYWFLTNHRGLVAVPFAHLQQPEATFQIDHVTNLLCYRYTFKGKPYAEPMPRQNHKGLFRSLFFSKQVLIPNNQWLQHTVCNCVQRGIPCLSGHRLQTRHLSAGFAVIHSDANDLQH